MHTDQSGAQHVVVGPVLGIVREMETVISVGENKNLLTTSYRTTLCAYILAQKL